jgi:hypothetical protein
MAPQTVMRTMQLSNRHQLTALADERCLVFEASAQVDRTPPGYGPSHVDD